MWSMPVYNGQLFNPHRLCHAGHNSLAPAQHGYPNHMFPDLRMLRFHIRRNKD